MARHRLTDEQWALVGRHFTRPRSKRGRPCRSHAKVVTISAQRPATSDNKNHENSSTPPMGHVWRTVRNRVKVP